MKRLLPFFLIFVLVESISTYAQTNVGGVISSNTIWTRSGSPYKLTSDLKIPKGITLTVQPGVTITGERLIQIEGSINWTGKSDSIIIIELADVFFKSAVLTNSHIRYVRFQEKTGLIVGNESKTKQDSVKNSGVLTIETTIFSVSSVLIRGYSTTASVLIKNSIFYGGSLQSNEECEPLELNNCEINYTRVTSTNTSIKIKDCMVHNGTSIQIGCCGSKFSIENSKVINSYVVNDNITSESALLKIDKSLFYKSSIKLPSDNIAANHCVFVNTKQKEPIMVAGGAMLDSTSIIGKDETYAVKITGDNMKNSTGTAKINYCTFSNHLDALISSTISPSSIKYSNFNNVMGFCLQNNSPTNIDAQNNWWGTADSSMIENIIFDASDNANIGKVNFSGSLNSSNTVAPITLPHVEKKSVNGGVEFKWNSNSEADLAGYKLYFGQPTGYSFSNSINVGNVTSYFLPSASVKDSFALTAYDMDTTGINDQVMGHESWFSDVSTAGFRNLDSNYCINASAVKLIAAPAGGIFSGPGIKANSTLFYPIQAGAGKHKLKYVYPSIQANKFDTISFFVNVHAITVAGTITTSDKVVCYSDGVALTLKNFSGPIKWQKSTNNSNNWTTIPGATSTVYYTPGITQYTYFRAILTDASCTPVYSNIVTVNPVHSSYISEVKAQYTNICLGNETYLYADTYAGTIQWQTSADSLIWVNTGTFDFNVCYTGKITSKTYYRAICKAGTCAPDTSDAISITVHNNTVSAVTVTSNDPTTFCMGGGALLNATVYTDYMYQWQLDSRDILGATSSSYTAGQTGNYSVTVTDIHTRCSKASDLIKINAFQLSLQPEPICMVGIDSVNERNFILWQKPVTTKIDSFFIYRENSVNNSYSRIGKIDYNAPGVFIDLNVDPKIQSYRYKISTLDSCGAETPLSDFHKTIHLGIDQGPDTTWNLKWTAYEGFAVSNYRIYRGSNPKTMQLIGTTTGSTSYADSYSSTDFIYYQVEAVNPNPCLPFIGAYPSSKSNIKSTDLTGIKDYGNPFSSVEIYPIPNSGVFTISFYGITNEKASIKIIDILGSNVFEEDHVYITPGNQSKVVNLGNVSKGLYFIYIQGNTFNFTRKILVDK